MRRFNSFCLSGAFLLAAALLATPAAQAQYVWGYSSISASGNSVYTFSYTEIDYASSGSYVPYSGAYPTIGTSSCTTYSSAMVGCYGTAASAGTYGIQTNHWVGAYGSDPDGFGGISAGSYAGSFSAYATGSPGSGGWFYVGTTYNYVTYSPAIPPSISQADGTDYPGYLVIWGSNLTDSSGNTSVTVDGSSVSTQYVSSSQVNVYYSGAVGNHTVTLTTPGGSDWMPFTIYPQGQTIYFASLSNVNYSVGTVSISATDTAWLLVSFTSSTPGVCSVGQTTLSGATSSAIVTLVGAGTCTITASQPGVTGYYAAANVTQSFTVTPPPLPHISGISVGGHQVSSVIFGASGTINISGTGLDPGGAAWPQVSLACPGTAPAIMVTSVTSTLISITYNAVGASVGQCTLLVNAFAAGSASFQVGVVPSVTISGAFGQPVSPGVALGGSTTYGVYISPASVPNEPVVLSLATISGSGAATFDNGAASMTISGSSNVTVHGTTVSSTADNIVLTASPLYDSVQTLAQQPLSVVPVALSILSNAYGTPMDLDDDGREIYKIRTGSYALGPKVTTGTQSGKAIGACLMGIEFIATVQPNNYSGKMALRRTLVDRQVYYSGTYPTGHALSQQEMNAAGLVKGDDTSGSSQAGGTEGLFPRSTLLKPDGSHYSSDRLYDSDAPGMVVFSDDNPTFVVSWRVNFQEYVILGSRDTAVTPAITVGNSVPWFARASCQRSTSGDYQYGGYSFSTGIANDNQSGQGASPLTYNLQ